MLNNYKKTNSFKILELSLPILISSSVSLVLGVTDTIMIGRTNAEQLAAVSAGAAVFSLISAVLAASLVSNQVLSAKYFGRNNIKAVYENMRHSFIFGMSIALITTVIVFIYGEFLLRLMIEDKQVIDTALAYLQARLPGLLIFIPSTIIAGVLGSYKKTKWIMFSSILTNISNVIIGYILIFGFGPFPKYGAVGAGISSSIANLIGLIFIVIVFNKEKIFEEVNYKEVLFTTKSFWNSQKMNFPQIGSALFDYLANLIVFAIMGLLGTMFLAGGRIAFQLDMFIFTIAMSLGAGGNILIGRAWGEGNFPKLKGLLKSTIQVLLIAVTLVSLPLLIFPSSVLSIFTNIEEIIDITKGSLVIIGISAPFISISSALSGVLRSLGKTNYDMYSNILPIWFVQLPVSYVFAVLLNFNLNGIYVGFLFYWIIRCVISAFYLNKTLKQTEQELIFDGEEGVYHDQ